jgi:glucosamine 6-phosphate synthetase-like amidotransferase/phosphosugar isomerase protein
MKKERPARSLVICRLLMCGIAGYSLDPSRSLDRTVAARALLAGIAERGADAVGFAYRATDPRVTVHKQRSGASALLDRVEVEQSTTQLLVHVRDYTKGHPRIAANNHPVRHGAVVGIHNGIIVNDDELFARCEIARADAEITVDSEIIFALAERSRGRTARALEELVGSMATAWLDEERPELVLARGMGRPLWTGTADGAFFFASTKHALELVEGYCDVSLKKRELGLGKVVAVLDGKVVARDSFRPDMSFVEEPLPSVRAPHEREATLRRLAALHAAA